MLDVGKVIERYLRCTDVTIEAYAQADASAVSNAVKAYNASGRTFHTLWERQEARLSSISDGAEREACAQSWVDAHLERKIFLRMELLLVTVRQQAAVATATSGSMAPRQNATHAVLYAAPAAFSLLRAVARMAGIAWSNGSSTAAGGLKAVTALAQPGFMSAVADAVNAIAALAASETASPEIGTTEALPRMISTLRADVAAGICHYASTVSDFVTHHVNVATACVDGQPAPPWPSKLTRLVKALAQSQLLGAAAAAVTDSRPAAASEATNFAGVCRPVQLAAFISAEVLDSLTAARRRLVAVAMPEGRRLACVLLRAMRHVAVRRLQVALLDQLAAHAGMGPELGGEMEEVEGREQEQEGGTQQKEREGDVEGWEGCSGTWWLPREETRLGQLVGIRGDGPEGPPGSRCTRSWNAGWLENCHSHSILATLAEWNDAAEQTKEGRQLAAEAGVPAGPPPLLAALLAARAAEALCRLCRGQGLGGAYAPAPEWQFAKAPALVLDLVTKAHVVGALPAATARSCLPHWLEAAGWATALVSDATAAAVGRLPATPRNPRRHSSSIDVTLVKEGSQGATLVLLLGTLNALAHNKEYGFKTLPAAAQEDVRRRLFRCGLAASLDHTLRLAYSAQDGGHMDVAETLQEATCETSWIVDTGVGLLLPPTAAACPADTDRAAGDEGPAADTGAAGAPGGYRGNRAGHQLALLYTLSKRAAMLTLALDQLSSSSVSSVSMTAAAVSESAAAVVATGSAAGSVAVEAVGPERGVEGVLLRTLSVQAASEACSGAGADVVGPGTAGAGEAGQEDGQSRPWLLRSAAEVVMALLSASGSLDQELLAREDAAWRGEVQAGGEAVWQAATARMQEARQALAMAERAASNLAAPLSWHLAAAVSEGGPVEQLSITLRLAARCISKLCLRMQPQRCNLLLLPPTHMLACQPHRLLAAACALEAALPPDSHRHTRFGDWTAVMVVSLASHKELSGRVRAWMAPQQPAVYTAGSGSGGCSRDEGRRSGSNGGSGSAPCTSDRGSSNNDGCSSGGSSSGGGKCSSSCDAGGSDSGSGGGSSKDADGCSSSSSTCNVRCGIGALSGCLAAPVQSAMRRILHYAPLYAVHVLALLKMAAGELGPQPGAPCCPGGGDAAGQAEGGYRQYAEAMAEIMWECQKGPATLETKEPLLPDGSRAVDLLGEERDAGGNLPPPPPPSAPSGPLPPPLVLAPGLDRALLRMCGNPRCGNFECEGEWALPLKLCGRCRAVRYCGADCQRAHWRGGHGAECKVLGAGMEG